MEVSVYGELMIGGFARVNVCVRMCVCESERMSEREK